MTGVDWPGFLITVLLIELTPGPNMAWLAGLALTHGRMAGLSATAGVALGLAINALLASAGLAALVAAEPRLQHLLHWAGAALMFWLARDAWLDSRNTSLSRISTRTYSRNFTTGFAVNLFNPKALLFFVVVLPPFLNGKPATLPQALALAATSVAIATAVHIAIVASASRAHRWAMDASRSQMIRRAMAVFMASLGIWLIFMAR